MPYLDDAFREEGVSTEGVLNLSRNPTDLPSSASVQAAAQQSEDAVSQSRSTATLLPISSTSFLAAIQQSQMHQILQQQQQSAFVQHQQLGDLVRGQLLALQERLQLNLVHQSQLIQQLSQCRDKKLIASLQVQIQQLSFEQQQLVQQIQIQQRHYIVQQGLTTNQGLSPSEFQKIWENLLVGGDPTKSPGNGLLNGLSSVSSLAGVQPSAVGRPLSELSLLQLCGVSESGDPSPSNPLYQHGLCTWPSCETPCDSYLAFTQHLNSAHQLDDRSTAQCRVQMQVVEQLEAQLNKERQRLQTMMQHLQMKQSPDTTTTGNGNLTGMENSESPLTSPRSNVSPSEMTGLSSGSPAIPMVTSGATTPTSPTPPASAVPQPIRRRVSDKGVLPIAADIARNREFYRTHDVRPPYTYASLIRQAIMEARDRQLTLNEIYTWFQDTFAYFRRNAATWKNAVRHNLSLHKCFARVENVKGAVWTVDDSEYYKRRPQRLSSASSGASLYSPGGRDKTTPYSDHADSLSQALHQNPLSLLSAVSSSAISGVLQSTNGSREKWRAQEEEMAANSSGMSDSVLDAYIKEEEAETGYLGAGSEESAERKAAAVEEESEGRLEVDESADS